MRSADLPTTLLSFVSLSGQRKEQRPPDEKHLVTFDSELGRLKSNKKANTKWLMLH